MNKYNKADQQGQEIVVNILKEIFSACTLTLDQHYEDTSPIDIYMTATTKSGISRTYAIECKDREYTHNCFNDSVIEIRKYNDLIESQKNGYKAIYFNTFSDGAYLVWDINKCKPIKREMTSNKSTVEPWKGKRTSLRYFLKNSEFIYSGSTHP